MGTLAFFPWLPGGEVIEKPGFRLLPFQPEQSPCEPGSSEQSHLDRILAAYHATAGTSIQTATVLQLSDHEITEALDDDDLAEAFALSELIAVSALSLREFFRHDYFNRDNYRLFAQHFQPDRSTVAIMSRRRDGSQLSGWPDGSIKTIRPPHVPTLPSWELDNALLDALLDARQSVHADRLHEAVKHHNRANTDSADADMADEAVMLMSAFQRVLDSSSANAGELTERLLARAKPTNPMAPTSCNRKSADPGVTAKFRKSPSVMQGWIEDFYALRGNLAHGKPDTAYPSVWSLREHLLLGSFLFPRVLAEELAALGYAIDTNGVQADIDLFEALACEQHFSGRDPADDYPWNKIRNPITLAIQKLRVDPLS